MCDMLTRTTFIKFIDFFNIKMKINNKSGKIIGMSSNVLEKAMSQRRNQKRKSRTS